MNFIATEFLQCQFLSDSHNAHYPIGRDARHVAHIIRQAVAARTAVPWEEVHSKRWMRGTKSTLPDDVLLQPQIFIQAPSKDLPDPASRRRRPGILKTRPP